MWLFLNAQSCHFNPSLLMIPFACDNNQTFCILMNDNFHGIVYLISTYPALWGYNQHSMCTIPPLTVRYLLFLYQNNKIICSCFLAHFHRTYYYFKISTRLGNLFHNHIEWPHFPINTQCIHMHPSSDDVIPDMLAF